MQPFLRALNHLLEQHSWARERLAPFAGETVELRPALGWAWRLRINADGTVAPAAEQAQAGLVVSLKPEAPVALARGEDHFLRAVEVSGNARLADAVMALARNLRWDFEEDLSRVIGDVAAHRVAEAARAFGRWQADAAKRLAEALAGYASDEARVLVARAELDAFAQANAALRDGLERLEQRIRRLG